MQYFYTSENPLFVTEVPEIGQFHFTRHTPDGVEEQVCPPLDVPRQQIGLVSGRLATMYIAMGPGTHSRSDIEAATGYSPQGIMAAAVDLMGMPPEAVTTDEGVRTFTFGEIAIASRRATDAERAAFEAAKAEARSAAAVAKAAGIERERERQLDLEAGKIPLLNHDHALLRIGLERYSLPFVGRDTLLAARVVAALAEVKTEASNFKSTAVAQLVWGAMTLGERALFANTEARMYGPAGQGIGKYVEAILDDLTGQLRLTRRSRAAKTYWRATAADELSFEAVPPETPYEDRSVIFPPGTPINELSVTPAVPAEDADIARATQIMERLGEASDEPTAIGMIPFVVSMTGRLAFLAALRRQGKAVEGVDALLGRVHTHLIKNLGAAKYWHSLNTLTVGGRYGGATRLGTLSATVPLTKKWRIVRPN